MVWVLWLQRRDIELFLNQQQEPEVLAELVEVESGAASDRPVLESALALCRKHKATLLVQKVDRLSRDLELLARLLKDKAVPVKVAQLPNADNFQLHLFGCLAAQEREFISTRTKAALAAAKLRGVQLGNPKLAELNKTESVRQGSLPSSTQVLCGRCTPKARHTERYAVS